MHRVFKVECYVSFCIFVFVFLLLLLLLLLSLLLLLLLLFISAQSKLSNDNFKVLEKVFEVLL